MESNKASLAPPPPPPAPPLPTLPPHPGRKFAHFIVDSFSEGGLRAGSQTKPSSWRKIDQMYIESTKHIWAEPSENGSSGICGQRRPRSDCADAQSDQGLCCPLTESLDTVECISGEQMPGWDFVHVQDDVNLDIICIPWRHIFAWRGQYYRYLWIVLVYRRTRACGGPEISQRGQWSLISMQ